MEDQQPETLTLTPTPSPKPVKRNLVSSLMEAATSTLLPRSSSFKEDSYLSSSLTSSQLKSLQDLKHLLSSSSSSPSSSPLSIFNIPLLPFSDRSDVILLKFLRARDFNPSLAHSMLLRCSSWRSSFNADTLATASSDELGFKDLESLVAFMHGHDRSGHPVCYNAYGLFKDKLIYDRVFGDADKLARFLRWRVAVMERGVRLLDLRPGGINSIIQVTDLKDMPKRELRVASNQILSLFQDNYPEMVARKIFINVPWYFSVLYSMISPFLTERTKSKFVIAREGYVAETLYKFIRPEFVPVQYGGLSRPGDLQSGAPKPASEFSIKGGEKVNLEIDGIESGATISWEIVVGGWDLEYGAEYVPRSEGSYTIAVEKTRRIQASMEEPVHNVFNCKEPGKLVLSIDNTGSRKRKVAAYRYYVRKA
ncbi:Phosphatidylinositol transfer protein SEC14 and related proteins protein [Dioscorea alata]|uniref:Phosphatidylinositol transfer protein SEC14 and related proteins protein n=1 Tax=Dioscorea alata TaxID=55571 RepID=A0ACB7V2N8_DIOAL|nr:Phosphatidylinositol transfer protein SEC14 and related proteins protein [Dioscorea alata]